ncbi:MAG: thrombospondin type 3 repeat-containing protein, partial [Candidatus Njordarchaeota archaeon]
DPLDNDTDNDGFSDGAEIKAGTDPLDPKEHPIIMSDLVLYIGISVTVILIVGVIFFVRRRK